MWGLGVRFNTRVSDTSSPGMWNINVGLRVKGLGYVVGVQGSGFGVWGLGFRVQRSEFRVESLGFRVWGSGLRDQG